MSLDILTAKDIRKKFEYRWPRICIDQRFWNQTRQVNVNPFAQWQEVRFERNNYNALDHLGGEQGIYVFAAKPAYQAMIHHSYILYVGETSDLKTRFKKYFHYKNSSHPSDQMRRRMVVVWSDCLYFYYFRTQGWARDQRLSFEDDLIDTIAPPINDEVRSVILKNYKKALQF